MHIFLKELGMAAVLAIKNAEVTPDVNLMNQMSTGRKDRIHPGSLKSAKSVSLAGSSGFSKSFF